MVLGLWTRHSSRRSWGNNPSFFRLKYLGNQPPFPAPRQPGGAAGVVAGVPGHGILSGEGAQRLEPMAVASFVQFAQDKRHGGCSHADDFLQRGMALNDRG